MSVTSTQLRRGALWSYIDNVYLTVGQFVLGVFLARLLGPAEFGVFIAATAFTSLGLILVQFGLPQAVLQAKELPKAVERSAFWLMLLFGAGWSLGLILLAQPLSHIYEDPDFVPVLVAMSATLLLTPYSAIGLAVLRRRMQFPEVARINIASLTVSAAVACGAALLGLGVYSLVLSGVVSMLVTGTMIAVQLRWVPGVPRLQPVRRLLSYAGFTTVNNLIGTSSSRIDNMLVGAFLGSAPLGLYNRAYSLARIPSDQFAESIGPLLLGSLSRVQEDHDESRRLYFKALSAISALTWPFLVILAVLGPTAVIWLYGDAWADVGVPLQVMIPGVFGLVVSLTLKGVINAQGLVRQLLVINVLVAVVTVLVVVLLAPFGLMAIAVGITLREYLMLWLMHRVVRRSALQIRFPEIVATVWPALAASAAALLAGGALEAAWMAEGAWAVFLKLASVSTLIFIVYAAVMLSLYRLVPGHESLGSTMRLVLEGLGGVVKAVSGLVQPRRKTNPEPSSD